MSTQVIRRRGAPILSLLGWGLAFMAPATHAQKKAVILAGDLDSHPPGTHEYEKSALLLKHCLETSPNLAPAPRVEVHFHGWPKDPRTLDDADTVVMITGGSDRRELDHPLLAGERMASLAPQMGRGCGLVMIHWSTFTPLRVRAQIERWVGGFFDYESGPSGPGGRRWHSAIETKRWQCRPATPGHPVTRGVGPFEMNEEFYYRLRFDEKWVTPAPLLTIDGPPDGENVVAWAVQRLDGGRGFGCTGGHFYANWDVPEFRRLILNAIAWTAKIDVPENGIESKTRPIAETRGVSAWQTRAPLDPSARPNAGLPVNRDRIYDFYAKEAGAFSGRTDLAGLLLPEFPGLDGGVLGHWGNQNEETWRDGRWNLTDHGSVVSNVFRGANLTIPKAVCVRIGGAGRLAAVFNPQTLSFDVTWREGFVRFSDVRHGFMDGAYLDGRVLTATRSAKPPLPFVYRGFYRFRDQVIFRYSLGGHDVLDTVVEKEGGIARITAPVDDPALAALIKGGPPRWPQVIETRGHRGPSAGAFAIDTLTLPFDNPWRTLLFLGDHDFFSNGDAAICTITGEVWTVSGIDETLEHLRWRRFATGLHQPLGLRIVDDRIHVLGRDQLTRLHDLNGDGEADFHECVSNAFVTSPAGHEFISGLDRDAAGRWVIATGNQGICRLDPAENRVEVIATGVRNPDGVNVGPQGRITTSAQEGEWSPASAVIEINEGAHYGYGGPRDNKPPALPLVYLPRGFDNSTGSQATVTSDRWGLPRGHLLGFSYGAGVHYVILRDSVEGGAQGMVVPLPGEFRSGVHRGRFPALDGQLYVSGMGGWGTYTPDDGCFQRVRFTGQRPGLPVEWHARDNGIWLKFDGPIDPQTAGDAKSHFAQVWNYRYGAAYGSPEYSVRWPQSTGHDPLEVTSAHVLGDARTLFLEIPQLRPVHQLHLRIRPTAGSALDLFASIHRLGAPFTEFPGYQPIAKAATPESPLIAAPAGTRPNPWAHAPPGRGVTIAATTGLQFATRRLAARCGEVLSLTFLNPDVVPHNFALLKPGTLETVGAQINRLIAEPGAAARHYLPDTGDVLVYTDMVNPGASFTIHFEAPSEAGDYPFLCSFPGHWQVMNGVLTVEALR